MRYYPIYSSTLRMYLYDVLILTMNHDQIPKQLYLACRCRRRSKRSAPQYPAMAALEHPSAVAAIAPLLSEGKAKYAAALDNPLAKTRFEKAAAPSSGKKSA